MWASSVATATTTEARDDLIHMRAAIALARAISLTKPAEARKLLDPLRSERPAISQAAITLIAKLPPQ